MGYRAETELNSILYFSLGRNVFLKMGMTRSPLHMFIRKKTKLKKIVVLEQWEGSCL
jgi:hypothetical protein